MNKAIKILALLFIFTSCVNRTENTNFSTNVSAVLEVPDMVVSGGDIAGIGNSGKRTYSEDVATEEITEAVFYIFDENGDFISKSTFAGADTYNLDFPKKGSYSVYVLCNMGALIAMPESPSKGEIESLTVPHRDSYDSLPFAGKAYLTVTSQTSDIKIALTRINSAILIENRNTDRVELVNATVTGLPSRGNIFDTGSEATGVIYTESAEAEIGADGNAVVYSFFVPEEQMEDVKIEAKATLKNDTDESGNITTALASLSFIDRLEAGKQATALVGYANNDLRIGDPDNWGNTGLYQLCGDVRLNVIGSEFFDYKNTKALRAYSGGSELSFTVSANESVASLEVTGGSAISWVTINNGTITVAPNTGDSERECQVAVKVGGNNVGIFHIVQGKAITFSCSSLSIVDNRLEKVGGTGSSSAVYTVTFDISDDELNDMEIVPENNGAGGVTVNVDRTGKTVTCHFMTTVDAATVPADGVVIPVKFIDINGRVNATLEVLQRPNKITFNPTKYPNISYQGGDVTATVTVEGDTRWSVRSITDKSGNAVTEWLTKISPSTTAASGGNLQLEIAPNGSSSSRIACVIVQSNFTYSKPYEIIQAPSYGLKSISANVGWDAATNTLKAYSKGSTYTFAFETETAVPDEVVLAVDCDPTGSGSSTLSASAITNTSGNSYSFTLTVPDSDDTDKEVTGEIDITANGITIGSFTVKRAYRPSFTSVTEEVWGGVKNRPELKKATYRASEWDLKDFTSSNGNITVTKTSGQEIEIAYAETLTYDAEAQTATITMNLNGGNKVEYNTVQRPVVFTITAADLTKLKNVAKEATDVSVTVTAQAGTSGTQWHVASTSDTWLTTSPAVGGPETNASGSALTVKFAANTTGDRIGSLVLESLNTTSPTYEVSQNGAFSATVSGVLYNGGNSAVFADGILKAFSAACDYTFSITTNNAVAGDKLSLVSKTSGSAITIKSQPSGSALATTHSFVISVPASTLTTEPESVFDIMADGNRIGGFTVKQAKRPSISVSTTAVIGGSDPVSGSFTASEWDVKSSGYVVSDNANMAVTLPSDNNGTFTVGMASSMNQSFAYRSATITLVGVTGNLGSCSISQDKVLFTFAPTSVSVVAAGGASQFTVTSSNAGTTTFPGMTATSSQTWCTLSVSGNKVTVNISANTGDQRSANVYVTYKNCQSQVFTVTQESAYDPFATVTIGGIQWTRYNLANPAQASGGATFAIKLPSQCSGNRADSHGKIYQWNRNVAWNSTGSSVSGATPSGSWYTTNPSGTAWSTSPCPSGYRLPTDAEYTTLLSSCDVTPMSGTWGENNYGYITLTDKSNSNNKLEFVAVGSRNYDTAGTLGEIGTYGNYWTSVQYTTDLAYLLYFNSGSTRVNDRTKRRGFSVRCVRQ